MARSLSRLKQLFAPVNAVAVHTDALAIYPAGLDGYAHFVSKAGTQRIESDNGRMRDYFARFTRKTKAVSRSEHMVHLSIKLYAHYHFDDNMHKLLSILR
jgi:IS1 family transposase